MKLKLMSDFHDYYDHWFDRKGKTYIRMSKNNISRTEMFDILFKNKLNVAPYNKVKNINLRDKYTENIVVYLDEYSHRGKDKELLALDIAKEKYPNKLASKYLSGFTNKCVDNIKSLSVRLLQIGDYRFWLVYYSTNDWKSNCGDCYINILEYDLYNYTDINYPMYAIDFVIHNEKLYAIDFNTSPGLKFTGVEEILTGKEIYNKIKDYYKYYNENIKSIVLPKQEERKIIRKVIDIYHG